MQVAFAMPMSTNVDEFGLIMTEASLTCHAAMRQSFYSAVAGRHL
jgi:hypothetical protein